MNISDSLKITSVASFISLLVVVVFVHFDAPELLKPGALIGIASFEGIDISQRVKLFYGVVISAGLTFALTHYTLTQLLKAKIHPWFFSLTILGNMTLVMRFFSEQYTPIIVLIIGLLVTTLFPLKKESNRLFYTLLSFSCTLYINGTLPEVSISAHYVQLIEIGSISFIGIWLAQRFSNLDEYLPALYPIMGLPLIAVLGLESFLICNQREVFIFTKVGWHLIYLILLITWIVIRLKKRNNLSHNFKPFLYLFVIAISTRTLYVPIYQYTGELFELANPANAMMRHFIFNEWPIIEYLSSHFLSEQIPQWFYTLLNGYHGDLSFMTYTFSVQVVGICVGYWFISRVLSVEWALLLLLIFPFFQVLIPTTFSWALLTIWFLHQYFIFRSPKFLVYLLVWTLGISLWRLDFGAAIVPSITLIFLADWITNRSTKEIGKVISIVGVFGALFIVSCVFINFIFDGALFYNVPLALDYLGASQAHGYPELASSKNALFFLHYYIFPVVVVIIIYQLVVTLWKSKTNFSIEKISLLFLGFFYLFNAQRGLVRHSFFEKTDLYISSFFFLFITIFFIQRYDKLKGVFFSLFSFVIILVFHFPNVENQTAFMSKILAKENIAKGVTNNSNKLSRVDYNTEFNKKRYDSLATFINENLEQHQTFIDFTHNPMLYFFSQKRVPSYFNQYLQNTITPNLQRVNVSRLNNIGLVIFNHEPTTPFDAMDGVPNELRYFYITEYIYAHFSPYKIVNGYSIWKPKLKTKPSLAAMEAKKTQLIEWPWYLGLTEKMDVKQHVNISKNNLLFDSNNPEISDAFEFTFKEIPDEVIHPVWIHYYDQNNELLGEIEFKIYAKNNNLKFIAPIGFQYNWISQPKSKITFTFPDYLQLESINLVAYAP